MGTAGTNGSNGAQGTQGSAGPGANQDLNNYNDVSFNSVTAGSFNSTSSIRYKKNVVTLSNATNIVKSLRGVRYDLVDNSKKNEIGVIAEEAARMLPEVVALDNNGRPNSVDYSRISAILIESIKDILIRLEKLEKRG
jgi:hypothetical protein